MKICAYVQRQYAKQNYKNECFDTRQFVGLRVVMDALSREGYPVEWAGIATATDYDIILVSLTADCDWWEFLKERVTWKKGDYKVIVGGAGVMHVTPFVPFVDYFSLGRGEKSVVNLVKKLDGKEGFEDDSIIDAKTFSPDNIYHIRQAEQVYPHEIPLTATKGYKENAIGCNHKCLFCGYTWQRKFLSDKDFYRFSTGLFDMEDKERAMLDLFKDKSSIDWKHLRSTAMEGLSERLRFMVNKRITRYMLETFLYEMIHTEEINPHKMKFFNIVGYPTETEEDAFEFLDVLREMDAEPGRKLHDKAWGIVLSSMHFNPTPCSPLACAPVSYKNHRHNLHNLLAPKLPGGYIYSGDNLWCVEGMGTETLATVIMRIIAMRGKAEDAENIERLCRTKKFWSASKPVQQMTLEKYFDIGYLFGEFTAETLPTRYLRTYCSVERFYEKPPWKEPWIIKPKP